MRNARSRDEHRKARAAVDESMRIYAFAVSLRHTFILARSGGGQAADTVGMCRGVRRTSLGTYGLCKASRSHAIRRTGSGGEARHAEAVWVLERTTQQCIPADRFAREIIVCLASVCAHGG